ncbi:MAG: S41 family peptidase [Bacteroidia bacterium]|nr:S41 family peptidase [Bacteroidia bacterium]
MKKWKARKNRLSVVIALSLLATGILGFSDDFFEVSKDLDIFSGLFREVNLNYVDTVDPGKLMKTGIDAMLASLDPYTNFIPESENEEFRFMTTGEYGGIGAVIKQKGDYVIISDPYEGYPAQKAGLWAGDQILEINGQSARGKKTEEVSRTLKGSPGTVVKLRIHREGVDSVLEKSITREEIKIKNVPFYGITPDTVGYIRLGNFTEGAGKEVANALRVLEEKYTLHGVILDLRGNPGGLLNEAVNVTNVFVNRGQEIVSTKGKVSSQNKTYLALNQPVDPDIPLAVLVSSSSASASEIVAGSLQDLDRGVIIGQRTFGKGLVQTTLPLSYNTHVKITVAKYYIPSGRCIQALDYAHRNEDGSVGKIPDSLISEFLTKNRRLVYDGGGIKPDLVLVTAPLSKIAMSLSAEGLIFDYATYYRVKHPVLNDSASFRFPSSGWNDFTRWLNQKDYHYYTNSEKAFRDLEGAVTSEKYAISIQPELDAIQRKLAKEKSEDPERNKPEICRLLEEEIISRYSYQSGRYQQSMEQDPGILKAGSILLDPASYSSILNGTSGEHLKFRGK